MENPNNREYTNGEITVFWKPDLCIHATICFMKLRKVFDPSKRPWVNMRGAATGEICSIVDQCPTDALTWKWNKDLTASEKDHLVKPSTGEETAPEPVAEIMLIDKGPALIKGKFRLINQNWEIIETADQIALCRCGCSKNLPYCDGSHRQ
ncbi:MAG: (4Fe-4S)-binding protein [Bacteroidota bacterium]